MKVNEKLIRPVHEAKYLDVENSDRYRSIARLFYLNYEKLKYWMYQEEVYAELTEDPYFADYTMEQCQQDLETLSAWGNLATIQDTRRVASIEEFKNKKFRYQLTETTVEIERMVIRLENLLIEGASLEPTLLERLRMSLGKTGEIGEMDKEKIYGWWSDLNNDFIRLNQNYQDYMRELNSVKAEEMMKTKAFLVFKDRLTEYLRTFVKSLQVNVTAIEQIMKRIPEETVVRILEQVTAYEMSIPRIEVQVEEQQIYEKMKGRWENIQKWFAGTGGGESEAMKVFDTTNEVIRKITRYASRLSEQNNSAASFRYSSRSTESINSGVFEEPPHEILLQPRVRTYREKSKRCGIRDSTWEKEEVRQAMLARLEEERRLLESYIREGRLDFASLPEIEPQIRDVFLTWLSKGLENKAHRAKTEDGQAFSILLEDQEKTCILKCTDGTFRMPAYTIVFE